MWAALGAAGLLPAAFIVASSSRDDEPGGGAAVPAAPVVAQNPIGAPQTQAVDTPSGPLDVTLTLSVPSEGATSSTLETGAPVELRFAIPDELAREGRPSLTAVVREAPGPGQAAAGLPRDIALERTETYLFSGSDGSLVLPSYATGGTEAGQHDHGAVLTAGMPAGGFAWGTTLTTRPDHVAADATGRWFATADRAGELRVVDLLRRGDPIAVVLDGAPTGMWFTPDGSRVWIGFDDRTDVVDPATGAVVDQVAAGAASVAFDDAGQVAVVIDGERAVLVDTATSTEVASADLSAPARGVAWSPAAGPEGGFVVVTQQGGLLAVAAGPGGVESPRSLGAVVTDPGALAVSPDGSLAVVTDRAATRVAVVDVASGELVEMVPVAAEPDQVVFLEHFAVIRNAASPDVTWIDLTDPSKNDNLTVGSAPPGSLTVATSGPSDERAEELIVPVGADSRIYRIHVMMGRPMVMGADDNPTAADRVVALSSALHEEDRGLVQRTVFSVPGEYRLQLTWPSGLIASGFAVQVAQPDGPRILATPASPEIGTTIGEPVTVTFAIAAGAPAIGEAEVLAYAETKQGPKQVRAVASATEAGRWQAELTFDHAGTYRVYLLSAQGGLTSRTGEPATVVVTT